jgi:serine/threonine protein kinase
MFSLGNLEVIVGIILYFMLSGYLPFYSPIYEEIVEQTKLCNISLRNFHWSNISKPAKNLVLGLLTFQK